MTLSGRHVPWLLPFFLLVQHAGAGAPASPEGAGAPHAFLCTPMGWQKGVGALPCCGSVQGTHNCAASQTSCFRYAPPCFTISGKSGAVTQPPAPMIDVQLFGFWPFALRMSSGTQTLLASAHATRADERSVFVLS